MHGRSGLAVRGVAVVLVGVGLRVFLQGDVEDLLHLGDGAVKKGCREDCCSLISERDEKVTVEDVRRDDSGPVAMFHASIVPGAKRYVGSTPNRARPERSGWSMSSDHVIV